MISKLRVNRRESRDGGYDHYHHFQHYHRSTIEHYLDVILLQESLPVFSSLTFKLNGPTKGVDSVSVKQFQTRSQKKTAFFGCHMSDDRPWDVIMRKLVDNGWSLQLGQVSDNGCRDANDTRTLLKMTLVVALVSSEMGSQWTRAFDNLNSLKALIVCREKYNLLFSCLSLSLSNGQIFGENNQTRENK